MAAVSLKSIPPSLRPVVRSYLMGYGAAVVPQLLGLVLKHIKRLGRTRKASKEERRRQEESFLRSLVWILTSGLKLRGLATFSALLAAGPSLLQKPAYGLLSSSIGSQAHITKLRLSRWLSSFLSAWAGLWLLQTGQCPSCWEGTSQAQALDGKKPNGPRLAGNTIDITLLTVTRAVDVLIGELWARFQAGRKARGKWTKAESFISYMADPTLFAVSCGFIMWSWFLHPDRLPPKYKEWITSAARGDERIIHTMRRLYDGSIIYGEKARDGDDSLAAVCRDYGLPEDYSDPAKTWPFPCVMFHIGDGISCEERAIRRFIKSWQTAMFTYLPLALAFRLRRPSRKAIFRSFSSASRSSAFLATYITLSNYGVCLARSRVGPLIAGRNIEACRRLDSGVSVGTACALCGWSIFVETKARRKDMALFVAPRALGTLVPRRYPVEKEWRERLAFALSAAILSTCIRENPKRVRGWLGRLLGFAIRE
ncbi:hypothetical protein LLEC1_04466 [Akanthomyces lecanii]|uniref:Integral membrane protein n=1 Tax=Cordyceps confragosa TaxID=2714763 RepID=A0A179IF56_CORDF|nr:hypothetical protein LLEC1_04466 [Akanthomyces lecanii]